MLWHDCHMAYHQTQLPDVSATPGDVRINIFGFVFTIIFRNFGTFWPYNFIFFYLITFLICFYFIFNSMSLLCPFMFKLINYKEKTSMSIASYSSDSAPIQLTLAYVKTQFLVHGINNIHFIYKIFSIFLTLPNCQVIVFSRLVDGYFVWGNSHRILEIVPNWSCNFLTNTSIPRFEIQAIFNAQKSR